MIKLNSTNAKKLVMSSGYKKIFLDKVKTNGGNSGRINCKKEFIDDEVVVFVLKGKERKTQKGGLKR